MNDRTLQVLTKKTQKTKDKYEFFPTKIMCFLFLSRTKFCKCKFLQITVVLNFSRIEFYQFSRDSVLKTIHKK